MNAFVVYFSGTGHTRTVAEEIAAAVNGDIESIVEVGEKRTGVRGKIHSGVESFLKEKSKIEKPKYDPADYDIAFVGTPTWGESLTPPVDSYLAQMTLTSTTLAFFSTEHEVGSEHVFKTMRKLTPGCNAAGEMVVKSGEFEDMDKVKAKIRDWIASLKTE